MYISKLSKRNEPHGKRYDTEQCTALDAIIRDYEKRFEDRGTPLRVIIVWSDNAPTQYRCRQNFMKVVSVAERFPNKQMIHRLAVVDNFKGNHDAVGKDPSRKIRAMELSGTRTATAEAETVVVCSLR